MGETDRIPPVRGRIVVPFRLQGVMGWTLRNFLKVEVIKHV